MKVQVRAAVLMSAFALVAALSGIGGAYAGTVLIGSKQIRNGSLLTQDYRKGSVQTSDVKNGSLDGVDIGANEVSAPNIDLPNPTQAVEGGTASASVGGEFTLLDPVTTYAKVDPVSVLEVTWNGSASAGFTPCQFQLRVDGQPAEAGAGTLYVPNGTVDGNVSVSALFEWPGEGPHDVAIYARTMGPSQSPCTVGPAAAQIMQTISIAEQVI